MDPSEWGLTKSPSSNFDSFNFCNLQSCYFVMTKFVHVARGSKISTQGGFPKRIL